jgi:AraC-like DNA-binding protein
VVETAKYLLDTTEMPVNEIAQELGFNYPNHFNRMFKKMTGATPLQYRKNTSK